jgi:predicted RND superfamily exporter protein
VQKLARLSLAHPRLAVSVVAFATLVFGAGALRITTDAGFRAYVGARHPAVRELDAFLDRFGGGLPVAAVWSCDETVLCETVFDPEPLRMAHAVAMSLARTAGVRSVASPATSPLLVPADDGFGVRRFFESGEPVPDADVLARRAFRDPLWVGDLISSDGVVGAVVFELASSESDVNVAAMAALQAALAPYVARGFRFHLVGDPVEFVVAGADLQMDSAVLVPAIAALIAGIFFVLFRSWQIVAVSLATVGLSVVWAFGVMGWLGWPQTAVTQALAPFILVVGVCGAIHLIARHASERAKAGAEAERPEESVVRVAGDVGGACLVAAATTSAGFGSFVTSGAVSFAHFGVIAAVGVMSALVLTFSLLPILIVRVHLDGAAAASTSAIWGNGLELVVDGALGRARLILAGTIAAGLACGFGIHLLRVEVDVYHLFGEESQVVQWIRFVQSHLRMADSLEVSFELPEGTELEDPATLSEIEKHAAFLASVDGLGEARTFIKPLGWINRLLNDDDPSFQVFAANPEANAELLLLLSVHEPELMDRWISLDHRRVRVSVEAAQGSYTQSGTILDTVNRYLAAELSEGWRAEVTGPIDVYYHMVNEVQRTQLRSFLTAAAVVFVMVALFFRSIPWALAAMVPTLLPVVITLGAMGIWGIYLDMGTAMVGAVVLGIAIDDTVHILIQYRRRRDVGLGAGDAIRAAILHVGRAVVTTSLALALGFFVLTLSSWESVASFGFLSGVAILGAMAADLFVLPALVVTIARRSASLGAGA